MASRVTIYGRPNHADSKRLQREFNAMYVDYDLTDPERDDRAKRRLAELVGDLKTLPLIEIQRADGDGSIFLSNPDEPTLRQSLYSENILSITSYWL
jgi:hypothetical protein